MASGWNDIDGKDISEKLTGTDNPDIIRGYAGDDTLEGGKADDQLFGGTGNDFLKGEAGSDYLWGDQGDDMYEWDGGNDTIYDESGNDSVIVTGKASEYKYAADWNSGHLTITANDGSALTIQRYFTFTPKNIAALPAVSGQTIEKIVFEDGSWGRDDVLRAVKPAGESFKGTAQNEVLVGTMGDDIIEGNDGTHVMRGGLGDDTYLWGPGANKLVGAIGDTVDDYSGNDMVIFGYAFTDLKFATDQENVNLWVAAPDGQTLIIENYFDVKNPSGFTIAGPIETLKFSDGSIKTLSDIRTIVTTTVGGDSKDKINGSIKAELLAGKAGNDTVKGNAGHDVLIGGFGHDDLSAGAGNDVIIGGAGTDTISGGAGRDRFVFDAAPESGPNRKMMDTIIDFQHGVDRIDLKDIDANKAAAGNNKFRWLLTGEQTFTKAGQLHYDAKTGILSGNTDKDASAEFMILLKNKPAVVTLADFIL
ncbi:calcium-binding protein [Microvirga pudoricolor]|uniref:calcium-binding protein n=1 Tax=Microvirga pudoricolor TaxID=2778729 RepID=UPI001951B820|nr:calcium-binding protein [Microvirga pudoricolor]MBM6593936.1 calcium-binding protein [Microvirga pudoricolor]